MILDSGYWPDAYTEDNSNPANHDPFEVDDFTVDGIQEWVNRIIDEWITVKRARKMTGLR